MLRNDLLLTPLPQHNETACCAAEEQCRIELDRLRTGLTMSSRIRDRLIRECDRMPGIGAVAQDLAMTPRTLRRRLDLERWQGVTPLTYRKTAENQRESRGLMQKHAFELDRD
ncbi:hypothetical protein [Gemmobacter aquatilis]|nr:hypothetical protein [Gemmobacter aquatilis]